MEPAAVFSHWHPDWSPVGAFIVAASASLIFFGCVVLHELAHSVVALSYGLRVRSITLFLFGGVSNIEHEPPSAKAEFFIAIAGPIMSVVLGVLFLILASTVTATSMSLTNVEGNWTAFANLGPVPTLLVWLGPINIVIGLFNLIPGFPLDGGRVLRSILWSVTGNLRTATLWAAGFGRTIAWLFIGAGIAMAFGTHLPFFGTGLISGMWLAFIGWFLHGAAVQATTRIALDEALQGMTVEQLMRRDGPAATPDLSVASLVHQHLIHGDERALPVVRDGTLVGLVSISDVRSVPPDKWATTAVGSIMRSVDKLTLATPDEPLAHAFEQLATRDIEQIPVVVTGSLVGMLRRRDVSRWIELAWKPSASAPGRHSATRPPFAPGQSHDGVHHAL